MYLARQETSTSAPAASSTPATGPATFDFGPVDLESQGGTILSITGFFSGFAILVVLARLYVRAFMLKTMGVDDYVMIVAMVS
jgi:hypothetical protein